MGAPSSFRNVSALQRAHGRAAARTNPLGKGSCKGAKHARREHPPRPSPRHCPTLPGLELPGWRRQWVAPPARAFAPGGSLGDTGSGVRCTSGATSADSPDGPPTDTPAVYAACSSGLVYRWLVASGWPHRRGHSPPEGA